MQARDYNWYDPYDDLFEEYIDSSPNDGVTGSDNTADPSGSEEGNFFDDTAAAAKEFPRRATDDRAEVVAPAYGLTCNPSELASNHASPTWYQNLASANPLQHSASRELFSSSKTHTSTSSPFKSIFKKLQRSTSPAMAQPKSTRNSKSLWVQRLESTADRLILPFGYGKEPPSPPPSAKLPIWGDTDSFMPYNNNLLTQMESPMLQHRSASYTSVHSAQHDPFNQPYHANFSYTPLASPQPEQERLYLTPGGTNSYFGTTSYEYDYSPAAAAAAIQNGMVTSPHLARTLSWEQGVSAGFALPFDHGPADFPDSDVQPWWPPPPQCQPCSPSHPIGHPPPIAFLADESYAALPNQGFPPTEALSSLASLVPGPAPVPVADMYNNNTTTTTTSSSSSANHSLSLLNQEYMLHHHNYNLNHRHSAAAQPPLHHHHHHNQIRHQPSTSFTLDHTSCSVSPPAPSRIISRRTSRQTLAHRRSKASLSAAANRGCISAAAAGTASINAAGFVNYTPDDSRKILTGVAPSGSSKTKARREKEAAEKRRKLSQAAARAVMEAGGDVSTLAALEREALCT